MASGVGRGPAGGGREPLTEELLARLLRRAGHSELYCKVRRDAVIIFCLEHGYSRFECDDELFRLGEKTIGADGAGAVG